MRVKLGGARSDGHHTGITVQKVSNYQAKVRWGLASVTRLDNLGECVFNDEIAFFQHTQFSAKTNRKSCCFFLSILLLFSSSQVFVGVIEQRSLGFFVRYSKSSLKNPIHFNYSY